MRIFFDTNVILAAYLWPGVARRVFETAIADHTPLVSEQVVEEAKRVLSRKKFDYLADDLATFEAFLRRQCTVLSSPSQPSKIDVRDPDDILILAAAQAAMADVLVTRDKDLLDLADMVKDLVIIQPENFHAMLS